MTNSKTPKIGLALGSGGVKGLAHIGVIKALVQNNIPIDYIAGSSAGALVGSAYAFSKDVSVIEKIALNTNWKHALVLLDPAFKSGGLIGGKKIEKLINKWLNGISFEKLQIPTAIVATDLTTGQPVSLRQGDIVKAIRASCAVPPIFKPVEYDNLWLADGGLSNPLPIKTVKDMGADIVVGVNLDGRCFSDINSKFAKTSLSQTAIRALNILRYNLAKSSLADADVIIEPAVPEIGLVGWNKFFDAKQVQKIILAGQMAAQSIINRIRNLLYI